MPQFLRTFPSPGRDLWTKISDGAKTTYASVSNIAFDSTKRGNKFLSLAANIVVHAGLNFLDKPSLAFKTYHKIPQRWQATIGRKCRGHRRFVKLNLTSQHSTKDILSLSR